MLAVRRHVAAVRIVGDRDVSRVGRAVTAIDDANSADFLIVALLDRFLDALDVEDDGPVLRVAVISAT